MPLGDLEAKYQAFGWNTRVIDGHDISEILSALAWTDETSGPCVIIANTTPGK